MEHYYEEEAHYYLTMMDFVSLVENYGDRVWADMEKYSSTAYEAFCAYKANQEIYKFVSTHKRDEDYYND